MRDEQIFIYTILIILAALVSFNSYQDIKYMRQDSFCMVWEGKWEVIQSIAWLGNNETILINETGFNNVFLDKMFDYSPGEYSIFYLQSRYNMNLTNYETMSVFGKNDGSKEILIFQDSDDLYDRKLLNLTFSPQKCTREFVVRNL